MKGNMIKVLKMYNEYHLYSSNKQKVNLSAFDNQILVKGVLPWLDAFKKDGDWKHAKFALKNSKLAQNSLDEKMAEFLNLTQYEFEKYIL